MSTHNLTLSLIGGCAACVAGIKLGDEAFARKALDRLRALKESGQEPSIVSPDLTGEGWFDEVFLEESWQKQAGVYLSLVRSTYL